MSASLCNSITFIVPIITVLACSLSQSPCYYITVVLSTRSSIHQSLTFCSATQFHFIWYSCFPCRAPKMWNSMSLQTLVQTYSSFKRRLKTHHFQSAYPAPWQPHNVPWFSYETLAFLLIYLLNALCKLTYVTLRYLVGGNQVASTDAIQITGGNLTWLDTWTFPLGGSREP